MNGCAPGLALIETLKTMGYLYLQLYDSKTQRYEVPVLMLKATSKASDPKYTVDIKKDPFSLQILRKDNGAVL